MKYLLLFTFLFAPFFAFGIDIHLINSDLECLGRDAREKWSREVASWTNGTGYIPNLRGNFKGQLEYELSGVQFCESLAHEHAANRLFYAGTSFDDPNYRFHNNMRLIARQNSLNRIQAILTVGPIGKLYNDLNDDFLREQCWAAEKTPHCQKIINRLLGLYIALDRVDIEFISIPTARYPLKRLQSEVAGRFGEAQVSNGERAKLRLLKLAIDNTPEQLNVMHTHLSQIIKDLESEKKNTDIARVNLWRTNIALIDNSKSTGGEYQPSVENAASELFNETARMTLISLRKTNSPLRMTPQELYSNLSELREYFITSGQIPMSELVTTAMGNLRTSSSELTPSASRRLVEKWTWGLFTSYGTSFSNIFWFGSLLFVLFFLIIYSQVKPQLLSWKVLSSCLYDAANILLLHEATMQLPNIVHITMKLVAFIFVSSAAGYLLMFLSNAQL